MKIYARQVKPEYQESPLFLGDNFFPEDIAVFGNRDFVEHFPDVVRRVYDVLNSGELAREIEYITGGHMFHAAYATITEAITAYMPPEQKEKYSTREIHSLRVDVQMYEEGINTYERDAAFLRVLDTVTGKKWDTHTIRGCCQGDWQEVYYIIDNWSREALNAFEVEYFNMGSEWIVQDDGEKPESPEDISGYSFYATAWDTECIRKAIADEAGTTPADVVLYEYKGERIAPIYCEV